MIGGFQVGPFQTNYQQEGTPNVVRPEAGNPGKAKRDRKKRWWQVDDKLYFGSREQIEQMVEAFVAEKSGDIAPPVPQLKTKLAPEPVSAALSRSFDLLRDSLEPQIDWTGFYQELAKRDFEAAQMLWEVLRRRREEQDDEEVLLLMH